MCELDFRTADDDAPSEKGEHNQWSLLLELCFHLEASPELTRFGDRRSLDVSQSCQFARASRASGTTNSGAMYSLFVNIRCLSGSYTQLMALR